MVSFQALSLAIALTGAGDTLLLDFTAPWCGPCRTMEPTIQRLASDGFPVRKIDVNQNPRAADQYHVTSVPCFVMVVNGREVDRLYGATSYERLAQMFAKAGLDAPAGDQIRAQSPDGLRDRIPLLNGLSRLGSLGRSQPEGNASPPSYADSPPPGDPYQATPRPLVNEAEWFTAAQAAAAPSADSSQQRALHASVRLRVEDPQGNSYGTGTIIDQLGDDVLVVTCGHIFRDSGGRGRVTVELFMPGAPGPLPGEVIAYDADQRDIGLVSFRPGVPVQTVRVAPGGYASRAGDRVFSVGCDHGQEPSVRESHVTAVDRYLHSPNITVAGQPVDGRSGGGLFTADGMLIGICNAADKADDEGIYASLPTIHWQLDRVSQSRIYQRAEPTVAAVSQPDGANHAAYDAPRPRDDSGSSVTAAPPVSMLDNGTPLSAASFQGSNDSDLLADEVICIVRSRENPGERRMFVVDRPSRELLHQLTAESQRVGGNGPAPLQAVQSFGNSSARQSDSRTESWEVPPTSDVRGVMRAQSASR